MKNVDLSLVYNNKWTIEELNQEIEYIEQSIKKDKKHTYFTKIIKTGHKIRYIQYKESILFNYKKQSKAVAEGLKAPISNVAKPTEPSGEVNSTIECDIIGATVGPPEPIKTKQSYNLYRVQMNLVDTINTNLTKYSKFITLTTREPTLERADFLYKFNKFKEKFRLTFGFPLSYVGVLERQLKRGEKEGNLGSFHIHLVVFGDTFLPFEKLKEIWQFYGSIDIKLTDGSQDLGRYLAKYLTKQKNVNNLYEHSILKSKGLKKPETYYDIPLSIFGTLQQTYTAQWDIKYYREIENMATLTEYTIINQK